MIDPSMETITEALTLNPGSRVEFGYCGEANDYVGQYFDYDSDEPDLIVLGGSMFIAVDNLAVALRHNVIGVR
jgi:hypothetical protein